MKYLKSALVLLFSITLTQCSISTLHGNEIALELVRLEREGIITQSERKDDFLHFFEEDMINYFTAKGLGHRIIEIKENWNVYEDKDFFILTGSVARTDEEVHVFTLVYKDQGEGKFSLVYIQIGEKKEGKYPEDIIPNL